MDFIIALAPLILGWILDMIFGDPERLPHPVVGFGKAISFFERRFNKGAAPVRRMMGGLTAVGLILTVYLLAVLLLTVLLPFPWVSMAMEGVLIFFCLAGKTLVKEVREVFKACDRSLDAGRRQVARIVGRDTGALSAREVRTAALETLAENLSDGVIAPLFWYAVLGLPGMLAYKMVNTLDSMIGYKNERYGDFGYVAANIDDIANWIPARVSAFLMVLAAGKPKLMKFVRKYGRCHASPNSGWPEAALAGILNCRFGGPHDYFGATVYKPYIGTNNRKLITADMVRSITVFHRAEVMAVAIVCVARLLLLLVLV